MNFSNTAWMCAFASMIAFEAPARTLEFCYDPYPPYSLGDFGPAQGGLKVQLLQEVVDRIEGVSATVTLMPWARCQDAVAAGQLDGILPLYPNEKREEYMSFTEGTFLEASVFWYSKEKHPGGLTWQGDVAQLQGLSLVMLNGSFIDDGIEAYFTNSGLLDRTHSVEAMFAMLGFGRADLLATDAAVGRYYASQSEAPGQFVMMERPIATRYSHFGLSKITKADAYIDAFNIVIAELNALGRIEELFLSSPVATSE